MLMDIFFYFILGIITSCHFAQYLVILLTIYGSLEELMSSGVWSTKLQYHQVKSLEVIFFLVCVLF